MTREPDPHPTEGAAQSDKKIVEGTQGLARLENFARRLLRVKKPDLEADPKASP